MTAEEREKNVILLLEYFVGTEGWIVDTHSCTEPTTSSMSNNNSMITVPTTTASVPIVTVASEVVEDDADEM